MAEESFEEFDKKLAKRPKSGLSKADVLSAVCGLGGLFLCGNLDTGEGMKPEVATFALACAVACLSDGKHTMGYYAVKTAHLKMRALKDVAQEAFKNLGKRVSQTLEQAKKKADSKRQVELTVKRPGQEPYKLTDNLVRKPATNPLAMMKQGRQGR